MKKLLFICIAVFAFTTIKAQYKPHDPAFGDSIARLKKAGKLTGKEQFFNPFGGTKNLIVSNPSKKNMRTNHASQVMSSAGSCNCWIPRDTSFHVVPFDGSGGNDGPGIAPTYANDDWSTNAITLPFFFSLYNDTVGTLSNPLYINNNGNISFGAPYSVFTAVPFPTSTYTMIAPFWGDVDTDTTGTSGGIVYYQLTPTHLIIQWDSVGVFNHKGQINSFQLIITDGTDSILPPGNNISFCYGEMQWTTGDASGGLNGFGGSPATVGINKGDGTNYFQISLFGDSSNTYSNLSGSPVSGVYWLSGRSFYFNSCGTGTNLPPFALDSAICDTLTLYAVGDSLVQRVGFIPPEANQSLTLSASAPALGTSFSVVSSTNGANASLTYKVVNTGLAAGIYDVTVTATDNGTPALSTTRKYPIRILTANTTGIKQMADKNDLVSIYPNPNNGSFVIETNTKQTLQVYDITGKMVLTQIINGKTTIDANSLSEGVYNLALISNAGIINKRLIIVK